MKTFAHADPKEWLYMGTILHDRHFYNTPTIHVTPTMSRHEAHVFRLFTRGGRMRGRDWRVLDRFLRRMDAQGFSIAHVVAGCFR